MVDIVVVSFNTRRLLERCLATLRAHTPAGSYTLHVVDNASSDGTGEWLAAQPGLDIIQNGSNLGYGSACNQGARQGSGDHIMFLNADVAALPGWLPPLVQTMESDEQIAVVGPRLVDEWGRIVGAGVTGTNAVPQFRLWMHLEDRVRDERALDCLSVCGAAYMIKRRLISTLRLFDERYFFYFEETDYSYNARDKGFRVVYCPTSRMIHTWGGSGRADPRLAGYFHAGQALFNAKWAHMMSDPRRYG